LYRCVFFVGRCGYTFLDAFVLTNLYCSVQMLLRVAICKCRWHYGTCSGAILLQRPRT
jgi:hypothetical protein